jgi:hypothetical protein
VGCRGGAAGEQPQGSKVDGFALDTRARSGSPHKKPTNLSIESFDIHIGGTASTDVEIYYKSGTYAGYETDSAAWTQAAAVTVTGLGAGNPTPLDLMLNIQMSAGQRMAFYVTTAVGSGLDYTNGTTEGALYSSNADLEIYEGIGMGHSFSTSQFSPRVFNGTVRYCP